MVFGPGLLRSLTRGVGNSVSDPSALIQVCACQTADWQRHAVKRPDGRSLHGTVATRAKMPGTESAEAAEGRWFLWLIGNAPWVVCRVQPSSTCMQCRHCGSMALCPMNTRELLARLITYRVSLQFCCPPGEGGDQPRAWDGVGIGTLCAAMCEISQRHAAGPDLGCVTQTMLKNIAQKRKCIG
jgi:hypothetical protein